LRTSAAEGRAHPENKEVRTLRDEDNIRLTRTGAGTPAGEWMRRYWQPVALAEELAGERPLVTPRVLGQDLVLFRDESGALALVDRGCPHRGADLALGRLEDGGLRCVFHGWLFDAAGRCLDTPAEPLGSPLAGKVRLGSYPVREHNGIVWGYLGPGEPPALPALDCFAAPDAYTFAWNGFLDCNSWASTRHTPRTCTVSSSTKTRASATASSSGPLRRVPSCR
jgi:phenylpropionate dioxygenase-like ring-hydroxylating dioxygenase large terminal subunit